MRRRINFKVPRTLIRLGIDDFETLLIMGLRRKITHGDINKLVCKRSYLSKRSANAVAKTVTDADLADFNEILEEVTEYFGPDDPIHIRTDHLTRNCNIKKLGAI